MPIISDSVESAAESLPGGPVVDSMKRAVLAEVEKLFAAKAWKYFRQEEAAGAFKVQVKVWFLTVERDMSKYVQRVVEKLAGPEPVSL